MRRKQQLFKYQIRFMKLRDLAFFLSFFMFLGCGTTKVVEGSAMADASLPTKTILNTHNAAAQNFNTLAARMQVKYEDPEQSQSITTSVRIEKDKTIWMKASILGITLAKVLITPDQVQFYESIDRSYFIGDFRLISNMLGTQIDFKQAQALLLGQSILELESSSVSSSIEKNKYKLASSSQNADFMLFMLLNPDNFMVHHTQISEPNAQRNLDIQYGSYQKIEGDFYPTQIGIEALDVDDKTSIDIKYKKIDLNVSVRFPFTIPDGYSQRTFN